MSLIIPNTIEMKGSNDIQKIHQVKNRETSSENNQATNADTAIQKIVIIIAIPQRIELSIGIIDKIPKQSVVYE